MFGVNPALRRVQRMGGGAEVTDRATYLGITAKSIYFVALTFLAAAGSFFATVFLLDSMGEAGLAIISGLLIGSFILSLITGFVAILVIKATPYAGSIYAASQGFLLGFTALMFTWLGYGGEVFAALFATVGVFTVMLILYAAGVIRVGSGFKKFMFSALIGIVFVNLIMFVSALISPALMVLFYGTGWISITVSVIMCIFASLMILIDLNRMTEIVNAGLDKKYEWAASFGLLITLIWLYMNFLRLFVKIAGRRR